MKIEKFLPSAALMPFIKEFIIIEAGVETVSHTLPGTSLIMSFRFRGSVKPEGDVKDALPAAATAGIRRSVRLFHYSKETANLLVVFNEGGFAAFSRIPAHELFGLTIASENLFLSTELSEILERIAEARSNTDRIDIIETFLLGRLVDGQSDHLVGRAIRLIKQHSGMIKIRDLATSLHISQDPFEKRFRSLVGSTPKQFASIIRLRNLIGKYPSYPSLTEASYDAGYFDQSHFIKDFKMFTGVTPKEFFKSSPYW